MLKVWWKHKPRDVQRLNKENLIKETGSERGERKKEGKKQQEEYKGSKIELAEKRVLKNNLEMPDNILKFEKKY